MDKIDTPAGVGSNDLLGIAFGAAFPHGFENEYYKACAVDGFKAGVAAERERFEQERTAYRNLLRQARVILRGPHVEQNILVRELIERIEGRGVHFGA